MSRKAIFDWFRGKLGRGYKQSEVAELDELLAALEAAVRETGKIGLTDAGVPDEADGWMEYAVPLVQTFEGFHRALPGGKVLAYPDPASGGDPWTIGWGSTGPGIGPGTIWTKAQAEDRFRKDLSHFGNGVEAALGNAPTSDQQFAALVSLAYNIGIGAFKGSTLLKRHKAGLHAEAASEFLRWNRAAGKVMPGLVRRRAAESELYRKGSQ